jgi:hypothetical protein
MENVPHALGYGNHGISCTLLSPPPDTYELLLRNLSEFLSSL